MIRAGATKVLSAADPEPKGCLKSYLNDKLTIYVKVVGLIDIKLEVERVQKRNAQLADLMQKLQKKMQMKDYEKKVPENVRTENETKVSGYQTEIDANQKSINDLNALV